MRSGLVNIIESSTNQAIRAQGLAGYNKSVSPSASSATAAYFFEINAERSYPSYSPRDHYVAHPLRCLSTTAVGTRYRLGPNML